MKTETKNPYVEVTWGSRHQVGNFYVNMFSPHVEYILLGRSLKPPDWPPHHFFFFASIFSPLSCPSDWGCNLSKSMLPNWCSLTWHWPHPTSSSKFLCKLSVPIVGCKKMEAFPALSWKIQNFYVNQQMPRIPGELVAKRTSQKKRAQIQRTQISSLPPHCN